MTYDPRTCELLTRGDIQYTSHLIKEKKGLRRGEEVSAEGDDSQLLLLETLEKVVMYCIDDIVITVHFSSILRNLSCCSPKIVGIIVRAYLQYFSNYSYMV